MADPLVDLTDRDVRSCNNPTFDGKNLSKNKLAEIAPQPAECDKDGEGPCGTDTGHQRAVDRRPERADRRPSAPAADPGGGAPPGDRTDRHRVRSSTRTPVRSRTPAPVDPAAGATDHADQQPADFPAPTELAASRPADTSTFGWVAAALLVALVLMPGILVSNLRRRPRRRGAP